MPDFAQNIAVVIGINSYGNGISKLSTAVNDAKRLSELLRDQHGYELQYVLLEQTATLKNLTQLLSKTLPQKVTLNDRLLFYFAGHGIALNGDDGPEGYLIPQDAKLGNADTYLSMSKLQAELSELPCRHFLGIFDCCFAGAFRWSSTRDLLLVPEVIHKERYDRFITDPAWQTITSAAYDQKALDSLEINSERGQTNGNHSPFAAALINALAGEADVYPPAQNGKPAGDGVITATELYLYLRDCVEVATEENRQRQTPGIWPLRKHDKGEYIFLSPGHELNLPPAPPLDESKNPYRGLQSFEEDQSDLFFGRQALTEMLGQVVDDQLLTVVLGASGSGKSSLVKAGLIPFLKQKGAKNDLSQWQILAPIRPGESPFKALANALTTETLSGFSMLTAESNAQTDILSQYLAAWKQKYPQQKLLLPIDQFEELITLCPNEKTRENFLQGLAQALKAYPEQLRLVITLRSDFEPQFQDAGLQDYWSAARFVVPPMTRGELREAIEEPASKRVMYLQSDDPKHPLIEQLIDEVAEMPGALPLLSFTLSELYLKYLRRQDEAKMRGDTVDRAITETDYKELGGVGRSLTQRAEQEYKDLVRLDPAYAKTIRQVMLRMVAVGSEVARRRVFEAELIYPEPENTRVNQCIARFSEARLLVRGQDADGQLYTEPAHDVLVRGWQRLLEWRQDAEETLSLQRRLTPAALEWNQLQQEENSKGVADWLTTVSQWVDTRLYVFEQQLGRLRFKQKSVKSQNADAASNPNQFLWHTNPYLDVLNEQVQRDHNGFNQAETAFIQQSVLQKRRNSSWRWRIATGVILGLSGLTLWALLGQRNTQLGQIRAALRAAEGNLGSSNSELDAVLSALQAGKTLEQLFPFGWFQPELESSQVRDLLQRALEQTQERNRLNLPALEQKAAGYLQHVGFDQDDNVVAIFAADNSEQNFEVWDVATQSKLAVLNNSDEQYDALADSAYPTMLWADELAAQVDVPYQVKEDLGDFYDRFYLSPNNRYLTAVFIGAGQGIYSREVWDLEQQKQLLPNFVGYANLRSGWHVSWNADSTKMLVIDDQGIVRVHDLTEKPREEWLIPDEIDSTLSASGQILAVSTTDGVTELWQIETQLRLAVIPSSGNYAFSDNNRYMVIRKNNVAELWNIDKQELLSTRSPDTGNIVDVAVSSDGELAIAAFAGQGSDNEGSVEIWRVGDERPYAIFEHLGVQNVIFSPNSDQPMIATLGFKGRSLYLWDLKTQQNITELEEEMSQAWRHDINQIKFSPDGKFLAISDGFPLKVWNIVQKQWADMTYSGNPLCNQTVLDATFSPDSQLIVSQSDTRTSGSYVCVRDWQGRQLMQQEVQAGSRIGFSSDGEAVQILVAPFEFDDSIEHWPMENTETLMKRGCDWVRQYLKAPGAAIDQQDRSICDDVPPYQSTIDPSPKLLFALGESGSTDSPQSSDLETPGPSQESVTKPEPDISISEPTPPTPPQNREPQGTSSFPPTKVYQNEKFTVTVIGVGMNAAYRGCSADGDCLEIESASAYENGIYVWENGDYRYALVPLNDSTDHRLLVLDPADEVVVDVMLSLISSE